jgi:hypothetical protein
MSSSFLLDALRYGEVRRVRDLIQSSPPTLDMINGKDKVQNCPPLFLISLRMDGGGAGRRHAEEEGEVSMAMFSWRSDIVTSSAPAGDGRGTADGTKGVKPRKKVPSTIWGKQSRKEDLVSSSWWAWRLLRVCPVSRLGVDSILRSREAFDEIFGSAVALLRTGRGAQSEGAINDLGATFLEGMAAQKIAMGLGVELSILLWDPISGVREGEVLRLIQGVRKASDESFGRISSNVNWSQWRGR